MRLFCFCCLFCCFFVVVGDGGDGGVQSDSVGIVGGFVDNSSIVIKLLFCDPKIFKIDPKLLDLHGIERLEHGLLLLERTRLDVFFGSIVKLDFEVALPNNSNDGAMLVGALGIGTAAVVGRTFYHSQFEFGSESATQGCQLS